MRKPILALAAASSVPAQDTSAPAVPPAGAAPSGAEGSRAAGEDPGSDAELEASLRAHSLTLVEPFAHPRRVWRLAEMPLAGTNKIDRAELTRLAARLIAEEPAR